MFSHSSVFMKLQQTFILDCFATRHVSHLLIMIILLITIINYTFIKSFIRSASLVFNKLY